MVRAFRSFAIAVTGFWLGCGTAIGAGANILTVSATVLSKSNCKFDVATSALNFGAINPASLSNATATATTTFICRGSAPSATFLITQDGGLNKLGPAQNRMRHTTVTTEYLPYSLALSPSSATVPKNTTQTLTITGTVIPGDFRNAQVGSFQDTVVITITP